VSILDDYQTKTLLDELHRAIYTDKLVIKPSGMRYGGYSVQSTDGAICINVETGSVNKPNPSAKSLVAKFGTSVNTIRLYQVPALNHTFEENTPYYEMAKKIFDLCESKVKVKKILDVTLMLQQLNGT